ncbi:MAG TPA: ABC transporter substrate-binding protein [Candidatus Binatia bacterium]|jgi:NitT/TauT family transport system substrate-binding protein|nr:ABC transporter substrate-binding protein [Candidatus Binatia bacterium]
MRHKKIVRILLTFIFAGTFGHPAIAQEGRKKLLVAYAGLISTHTSVWLAEDQGFFKKHGLDVTSVFTGSGSVTSQALVAGEVKLASTSVGPTAGAIGGGADLVILAGLINILPYQLWVHPQVRQSADLKGKRAAISTFGSGSHLAVEVALQHLGLDPARDKIAIMQVGQQPERVAALISGRIDATALDPGFAQAAKDNGLTMMLDMTKMDVPFANTVVVSSRRFVKENPQLIESFLKGTIDGLSFLPNPANEKAMKNVLARRLKLTTPESIQAMYDATVQIHAKTRIPYAPAAGVQNMIDALHRVNPRLAKLKAADIIDNSFIERLEKSGYFQESRKRG